MTHTIYKGLKFCLPPMLGRVKDVSVVEWKFMLDNSFIYEIGEDQLDIQKLFGIRFNMFDNHQNSARFGARYAGEGMAEILAYCYDKGVRLNTNAGEKPICKIELNRIYKARLTVTADTYIFDIFSDAFSKGRATEIKTHNKTTGYKAGFNFNVPAPHKMKLKIIN